jgi:hypothetical protein
MNSRTIIKQVQGSPAGVGQPNNAILQTITPSANVANPYWNLVAAAQTNLRVVYAITVANLKYLCIFADQACTIKTNSSGSPTNTIVLLAGQLIEWYPASSGEYAPPCPFTADVTALYITTTLATNVLVDALVSQ